jgi:hypothetical protein
MSCVGLVVGYQWVYGTVTVVRLGESDSLRGAEISFFPKPLLKSLVNCE